MSAAPGDARFGQRAVSVGRATSSERRCSRARRRHHLGDGLHRPNPPRGDHAGRTLTVPVDFAEMYRRVGCKTKDILTEIEVGPRAGARASSIIHEMEAEALGRCSACPAARLARSSTPRGCLAVSSPGTSKPPSPLPRQRLGPSAPALARVQTL